MYRSIVKRVARAALLVGSIAAIATTAVADTKPAKETMSAQEANKAKFRMFYEEIVNQKKLDRFDEYVGKSMKEHQEAPGYSPDYAGVKQYFTDAAAAFPDLKVTIDVILADGDLVAAQATWTGTNKGPFMGAPATGKPVTFRSMDVVRIQDGKAVEHWGVSDDLSLMTQLGMVHMHH